MTNPFFLADEDMPDDGSEIKLPPQVKGKLEYHSTLTPVEAKKEQPDIDETIKEVLSSMFWVDEEGGWNTKDFGYQTYLQIVDELKQALYQRLASEAVIMETYSKFVVGYKDNVKAIPISKLAELMGVKPE